jgi:low affinity Fe/Cu permease
MAAVSKSTKLFTKFSNAIARAAGRPATFVACCALVVVWALSGPIFGFSDTWQLVINTGTTVITFLMVFVIQNTQNRDGAALQAKLDELIRASAAQNAFIGIEHLTDEELDEIRKECEARADDRGRELTKQERARAAADIAERRVRRKAGTEPVGA